jgi:putative phosphoesterase
MRIGLISDTHGYLDKKIFTYFKECDEIWHAGDIGSIEIVDRLSEFKKLRGVYGNIDDREIRQKFPAEDVFEVGGTVVFLTHIGGYPPRYTSNIRGRLDEFHPDLFVCGHSHIVKIMHDHKRALIHINPGAAGKQGFHKIRTIVRFSIISCRFEDMQVIELGRRA